jgi:hypothetical protein
MKRKMVRKQQETSEEQKEAVLPAPVLADQQPQNTEMTPADSKDVLLMRVVTWLRDSHALFDYESRQIQKKNMKVEHSCKFIRQKDEVRTVPLDYQPEEDQEHTPLFSLVKEANGEYFIDAANKTDSEKLWLVVRALKHDTRKLSYELNKTDIIKLGRIQFRVKDLQTPTIDKNDPTINTEWNEDIKEVRSIIIKNEEVNENDESSSVPQWRFWWLTECSEDNPLINAWVCTGTMKFIHLHCLKRWVCSKVKPLNNEKMKNWLESFIWKNFECEVCKTKYPYILKNGPKVFNIFDIEIPDGPFWILESLSMEKNSSRMIFIMKPTGPKMEFKVGRGHDSDIRVSDISVSRYHARVKYEDGKFLLEDNTSKFGTLVQIKDKTQIKRNHTCAVQSGRTVATYMLKSTDFLRQATSRVGAPIWAGADMQARKPMDLKEEAQNLNRLMEAVKSDTQQFNNQNNRPPNWVPFALPSSPVQMSIPLPSEEYLRRGMNDENDNSEEEPENN